jgi:hypothetical protein
MYSNPKCLHDRTKHQGRQDLKNKRSVQCTETGIQQLNIRGGGGGGGAEYRNITRGFMRTGTHSTAGKAHSITSPSSVSVLNVLKRVLRDEGRRGESESIPDHVTLFFPAGSLRSALGRGITVLKNGRDCGVLLRKTGNIIVTKFSPFLQATKALRESTGIALLCFYTSALEGGEGSASRRGSFLPERPGTHCTGGWVGPRAGVDRCGKSRPHRDSIPEPSSL